MGNSKQAIKNSIGFASRLFTNATTIAIRTPFTGVKITLLAAGAISKSIAVGFDKGAILCLDGADKVTKVEDWIAMKGHAEDQEIQKWMNGEPRFSAEEEDLLTKRMSDLGIDGQSKEAVVFLRTYVEKRSEAEYKAARSADGEDKVNMADLKKSSTTGKKKGPAEKTACKFCQHEYAGIEKHEAKCQEMLVNARVQAMNNGMDEAAVKQAVIDNVPSKDARKGIRAVLMSEINVEAAGEKAPGSVLNPAPVV